jgi:hypothetical protein
MNKVLIISYYFPPVAGASVQRVAKLVKYLPNMGYEPVILTNKSKMKRKDNELFNEVKHNKIFYCRDLGKNIPGEIRKLFLSHFQPDKLISWKATVIRKAVKIIKDENINLIFASSPPHSIGYIAALISQKTGVPFILDFRDEWITFPLFEAQKQKYKNIQKKLYDKTIANCSGVTTVNKTLQKRIITDELIKKGIQSEIVYNGYDESDIPAVISSKDSEKIRICYNGRFKKISNPSFFFEILNDLLNEQSIDKNRIEFICLDDISNDKWIKNYDEVKKISTFTGYLPLKKTYEKIAQSDVGLLLLTNYGESTALPLKMFDYIALGINILAIVDKEDELTDFVRNYKNSKVFLTRELKKNKHFFLDYITHIKERNNKLDEQYQKLYTRELQTSKLAYFFDSILNKKI